MVIGEGGLIWQANNAKVEHRAATVDEEVLAWKAEKQMAKYTTGITPQERDDLIADQLKRGLLTEDEAKTAAETGQVKIGSRVIDYGEEETPTPTDPPTEPPTKTKNEIAQQYDINQTEDKTVKDDSESPKSLTIPAGFTVVNPANDDTVKYADNDNPKVDEGIVVTDGAGNEFVWVPVPDINDMAKKQNGSTENWEGKLYNFEPDESKGSKSTEMTDYGVTTKNNREPAIVTGTSNEAGTEYDADTTNLNKIQEGLTKENFKTQLQSEFNSMIKSVDKYKGFYIGRYEASNLDQVTPIVQKDKTPTVSIDWYTIYKNSQGVAKEGLQAEESASVTSSMIWGCQWDAVMNWFIKCGEDTAKYVTDSTDKGYYSQSSKTVTGSNTAYRVNNIYDMAGNVWEWTLEANVTSSRVYRGGYYYFSGSSSPASARYNAAPAYTGDYHRFTCHTLCKSAC